MYHYFITGCTINVCPYNIKVIHYVQCEKSSHGTLRKTTQFYNIYVLLLGKTYAPISSHLMDGNFNNCMLFIDGLNNGLLD